jgi:hypothetical protein
MLQCRRNTALSAISRLITSPLTFTVHIILSKREREKWTEIKTVSAAIGFHGAGGRISPLLSVKLLACSQRRKIHFKMVSCWRKHSWLVVIAFLNGFQTSARLCWQNETCCYLDNTVPRRLPSFQVTWKCAIGSHCSSTSLVYLAQHSRQLWWGKYLLTSKYGKSYRKCCLSKPNKAWGYS